MKIWMPTIRTGSGTDVYTIRLADGLRKRGIEVSLDWFPLRYELSPWMLRKVLPPPGTSIIHTNSWHGAAFYRSGIPMVTVIHHVIFAQSVGRQKGILKSLYHNLWVRQVERIALSKANAIVAVSESAARMNAGNALTNLIEVIYNGVDVERFNDIKGARDADDHKFKLLFVGNPCFGKGADRLAKIAMSLEGEIQLDFTGGLKGVGHGRLGEVGRCLGKIPLHNMPELYSKYDALIMPSRGEACPLSVIEAMAAGLPVIASKNTALMEIVENGVNGFLCEEDNIQEYVCAINLLRHDHKLQQSMGRASRVRAVSLYSEDMMFDKYLCVYSRMVGL